MQDPISKITRVKIAGHVTQEVEHLLRKLRALSSNPSNTKKKKKKKRERERKKKWLISRGKTHK
jgi:hypothetical protein